MAYFEQQLSLEDDQEKICNQKQKMKRKLTENKHN